MKYIRTKDTIFEVLEDYKNCWLVRAKRNNKKTYPKCKKNSFFVNQADTIEELCDEIVEVIDDKPQVVYADISFNDLAIAKIRDKNNATVYGAMWTDKGLIYVAKMNEKGELELL